MDTGGQNGGNNTPLLELQEIGHAQTPFDIASWVESAAVPAAAAAASGSSALPPLDLPTYHPARAKERKSMLKKQTTAGQRKWIVIDSKGDFTLMTTYKNDVAHQMGIQLRDLRLLDPQLAASYPSAILCREKALVINLEYIKMIVTVEKAYVTNLDDENVTAFVEELRRRLFAVAAGIPPSKSAIDFQSVTASDATGNAAGPNELPFELRVLEVALDHVSYYLERLTSDLESSAHPALDALTVKVSTANLERVRRIKNRMVRLTTRVETLREVLEKFLDDDGDMHDMNLSARDAERQADALRTGRSASATPFDVPLHVSGDMGAKSPITPRSAVTYSDSSEQEEEAIEEVEMLLEAYFMRIDNTYNKLQALGEYVDDTEDFINIELDNHRNQLIRIDLLLTTLTSSVAFVTAITGLFAMNLQLSPGQDGQGPYSQFVSIAVSTSVVAIVIFVGTIIYCRKKRLL